MKRLVWNHESYYWYETNCLQPSHTLQVKQNVLKLTTYFWGETICFKLNQILLRWNKLSETIIRLRWNGMYFGGETKCHKPLYFWDETKCFQSHHHAFEMKGNVLNQTTMSLRQNETSYTIIFLRTISKSHLRKGHGPWCDLIHLAKKSSARSNATGFLGISKHVSCYHGLFRRCMPRFTALQKGWKTMAGIMIL